MTPDADRLPGRRRWRALGLLGGVQFMLILDETVVNVALASIRGELGFDAAGLTWVVNAYLLSFGGLLLVGGRAGDVFGRRRVLVLGLWVFGAASLACGLAEEPWHLIVGRTAQGIGAALISPTALALVSRIFVAPAERARAFSVWGALAVVGGTTGVVISGWLTEVISWRSVFLVNLLPVAAAIVVAPRLLADSHDRRRPPLSLSAVVLATGATACLVQGLLVAGEDGLSVPALGWVGTSVVAALLFVRIERRSVHRLVPPTVLALPVRRRGHIACLLLSGSFLGCPSSWCCTCRRCWRSALSRPGWDTCPTPQALCSACGHRSGSSARSG